MLRWYPREWRARYGEEFTELLVSDMSERSRSLRTPADVAVNGIVARLAYAGLGQSTLEDAERTRRTLLAFACAAAVFVTVGLGMWAQLTIGWQWSPPDTVATSAAMFVMSSSVLVLLAVGAMAVVPLAWPTARAALRRRNVVGPLVLDPGRRRHPDRREPPLRERLARNRWPPVGAPGPRPRWSRGLRVGCHALRDGVLGASGGAPRISGPRDRMDGAQPRRLGVCGPGSGGLGTADRALAEVAALRGAPRPARGAW